MPKRRTSKDDDGDFSAEDAGSGSDSYAPDTRKPKKQRKTASGDKSALRRGATSSTSADSAPSTAVKHDVSRHSLNEEEAEGAATDLLNWFAGVHEARGMPWRKPFNPKWTVEERGQRAYEASVLSDSCYNISS
jgi:A/G-specific adenine glycosylase